MWLAALAVGIMSGQSDRVGGVVYPGVAPGKAECQVSRDSIRLGNCAIRAEWELSDRGLHPKCVRDVQMRRTLTLRSEAFVIVMEDGSEYRASDLTFKDRPLATHLSPRMDASRLAESLPGRRAEAALATRDGKLGVRWRATLRDGGNYVRQEVAITPLQGDLHIREIVWLRQVLPNARAAGSVEGSPLVAGSFFLGCEDPMAWNGVEASEREVGSWSPDHLAVGERRVARWDVPGDALRSGTNTFAFRYDRGPHRLDIWRVAMLEDGREVAVDEHHGFAGNAQLDNIYYVELPKPKRSATYQLEAVLSTDPDFHIPADGKVESWGRVMAWESAGEVVCRVLPDVTLRIGETLTQSFVVGVAPEGQMRRGFLHYIERERAHPYRPYLHYNSWYDIAWEPFALNETNCLDAIRTMGERLVRAHGVVLNGLVFDDGWDDPASLWQFHDGFPSGFAPLAELCKEYDTRLGVWLSPFGGYGRSKEQRLQFGREQGYETNDTGFALSGPKYYAAFKRACANMIRRYGVNHFKFDGIAGGMYASGGGEFVRDTEALRRLMLELREVDPNVYINFTTGSWPSPFWTMYADSIWRQGGDMGVAGKGSKQQQWLTYRDQETYRNIVRKGPLYPLNSLMTQGVAYSRQGMAGDPSFESAGFKADVRAFFGSGTSLQELYIQPGKLSDTDWAVLAEAAKWARANADVLVDTHWIGGDPSTLQVYGYASWSPRKGIVMLRNPDERAREFLLDVGEAFELPKGAARSYALRSPWAEDAAKPPVSAKAGQPVRLELQPFEVVILDATPVK